MQVWSYHERKLYQLCNICHIIFKGAREVIVIDEEKFLMVIFLPTSIIA